MARYKTYNYAQRVMIPVSLEEQVIPGTLEHAIHVAIEERLDLSGFDQMFRNDLTGRPAYSPKVLLKLILLAYSRGITSSRRIEAMCNENILFMALACDQRIDHATIANFVSELAPHIKKVFLGVLLVCEEMGLLGGTVFALDGTKLHGNASKELSGTREELRHKADLFRGRLKRLIHRHESTDAKERQKKDPGDKHFRRQETKLRRTIRKIEHFLETEEARMGKRKKELKSNITDPDSAKMKTASGTIQGYNAQAFVDAKHQIIVAGEVTNNSADNDSFQPMVISLKENLKKIGYSEEGLNGLVAVTDSGYFSEENIKFAESERLTAFLPDSHFRARDPRYSGQFKYRAPVKFPLSSFVFDDQADVFRCPTGQNLTSYGKRMRRGDHFVRQYVGKPSICQACSKKDQCLATGAQRRTLQIPITGDTTDYLGMMRERIDSPEGREIYAKRFGIVEPVFGNLKAQKGLRRLSLRGKIKANTQWLLSCIIHNLEKVANNIDK